MEENKESVSLTEKKANSEVKSKDMLKWVIFGLVVFMFIVLIFGVGMFVGGMKARFSYQWAESYHQNFAGPRGGFLGDWRSAPPFPGDFIAGHGDFGEIIKINDSDFVIKGRNNIEKIIIIKEDTVINMGNETIKKDDLKIGDQIIVIGLPNDLGQIEAKLIRIFPKPSSFRPQRINL